MFDVLFPYLATILTPTRLRQPKMLSWLLLIISHLSKVYDRYISYRGLKLYDINFTGQTIYLQKKLRDTFGCQGIVIEDGLLVTPFYLSNKNENHIPVYIGNYFKNGYGHITGDWIVFLGYWYEYIASGNGNNPDVDNSAQKRGEYKFVLSNQQEMSSQNDFVVKIPIQCYNIMTGNDFMKMKTILNYYKLANKFYTIISY